jgi:hypothetical protein
MPSILRLAFSCEKRANELGVFRRCYRVHFFRWPHDRCLFGAETHRFP